MTRQIFITPLEFSDWLREDRVALGVEVIIAPDDPKGALTIWDADQRTLQQARAVFVGARDSFAAGMDARDVVLGRLGWVSFDVPRTVGDRLNLIGVGAKSDWLDEVAETVHVNSAGPRLYARLWRRWKRRLKNPVMARGRGSERAVAYRDVYYSTGAAEWHAAGGLLRQDGVDNVLFELPAEGGTRRGRDA